MPLVPRPFVAVLAFALGLVAARSNPAPEPERFDAGGFRFELEAAVPLAPEAAYDAFTGDVRGWWDHTISGAPRSMVLEARPGGAFREVFDEAGNGVDHARVQLAWRGKRLRFVGPLGLGGEGVELHHDLAFEPAEGGGTTLRLKVTAVGRVEPEWPAAVEGVWRHFLHERFVPWVEDGGPARR